MFLTYTRHFLRIVSLPRDTKKNDYGSIDKDTTQESGRGACIATGRFTLTCAQTNSVLVAFLSDSETPSDLKERITVAN